MASRYGLQIRTAAPTDTPGVNQLMDSVGHRMSASTLAERLEKLRSDRGAVLLALEWGPPSGLVIRMTTAQKATICAHPMNVMGVPQKVSARSSA